MKVKQLFVAVVMSACALIFSYHALGEAFKHVQAGSTATDTSFITITPMTFDAPSTTLRRI